MRFMCVIFEVQILGKQILDGVHFKYVKIITIADELERLIHENEE